MYICMNRWLGVGADYLERYSKRTDNVVFLHIKRTKKPVEEKQEAPAEKVSLKVCVTTLGCLLYHIVIGVLNLDGSYFLVLLSLSYVIKRCHGWPSTWKGGSRLTRRLSMMRRLPLFCFRPCRK